MTKRLHVVALFLVALAVVWSAWRLTMFLLNTASDIGVFVGIALPIVVPVVLLLWHVRMLAKIIRKGSSDA